MTGVEQALRDRWVGWVVAGWLAVLVSVAYWPVIGNEW